MAMTEMKISIPEELRIYLTVDDHQSQLEGNAMLLYPYIKNQTISNGRAAEIPGISKWQLIEFYNRQGLPYLDYDAEVLEEDLKAIRKVRINK